MLEKLEEAVADEEPALVQETNGVQATKMEAAAVGAPAPAKIAAVAVAEPPKKVEKKVKSTKIYSLKEGLPEVNGKDEVCVFLTPSSQKDYQVARMLAENGVSTVLVNGSFKVMKCCYVSVSEYMSSRIRNEYSHLMHNNFSYRKNY